MIKAQDIYQFISRIPVAVTTTFLGLFSILIGATGSFPFGNPPLQVGGMIWRGVFVGIGFILIAAGIYDVWRRKRISPENQEMNESLKDFKFYTFLGINKELRTGEVFQDFNIKRPDKNINAIYYLWADTYAESQIHAFVTKESFLRISFNNHSDSYPCNVAIRPENEKALSNTLKKAYLTFEARIPEESLQNKNLLKEIGIAIRIVNGWMQHWEYAISHNEYIQFKSNSSKWTSYFADLNDASKWMLFKSDGNYLYGPKDPDFKIITSVIIEVGKYKVPGRPYEGEGVIDIRSIKLTEYSE